MGKVVAISDIHGEYNKLTMLMNAIVNHKIDPDNDVLVFLGDYVDGGPDSKLLIDAMMCFEKRYPHWVFLMGNHEQMMLQALHDPADKQTWNLWWNQGGEATAWSYFPEGLSNYNRAIANPRQFIPESHLEWMANLPFYHETDYFFFVHGGVIPGRPPKETPAYYMLWLRDQFYESDYDWGKMIVAGHTYHEEPLVKPNLLVLDTMMHGLGEISAVVLNDETGEIVEFLSSW